MFSPIFVVWVMSRKLDIWQPLLSDLHWIHTFRFLAVHSRHANTIRHISSYYHKSVNAGFLMICTSGPCLLRHANISDVMLRDAKKRKQYENTKLDQRAKEYNVRA
jgi:hypothetical protein